MCIQQLSSAAICRAHNTMAATLKLPAGERELAQLEFLHKQDSCSHSISPLGRA
jgi:hypothetical protein